MGVTTACRSPVGGKFQTTDVQNRYPAKKYINFCEIHGYNHETPKLEYPKRFVVKTFLRASRLPSPRAPPSRSPFAAALSIKS